MNGRTMTVSGRDGLIVLTINGRPVEARGGATLLEAARTAGVHIPTLCHHPGMTPRAVCRMCLVKVNAEARPQPACSTPARDGDAVETEGAELQALRKADAAWMLAHHPNDCMRCEVDGSCQLQRLVNENQWKPAVEKVPAGSPEPFGLQPSDHTSPSIWRDLDKCIECGLCADVCGEAGQQQYVIGFAERGSDRLPVTAFDQPLSETGCISCGQCTRVCPVGALSSARTTMGQVHSGLVEAALRLGIRHRMVGPYNKENFRLQQDEDQRSVA